ncbi:MAG: hypothetical protein ACHP6H_06805 [Legionellales bacterium]
MPTRSVLCYYLGVPYTNVSGILVTCRFSGTPIDTSGIAHIYSRNWEAALFANTTGDSLTNAGSVSLNATPLSNLLYNTYTHESWYLHYDTTIIWNDSAVNHWAISGSSSIPPFTANINGIYPSFNGILPDTISKTTDFFYTFNSSNTTNGDSAYVLIYYDGWPNQSKVVSANGGTATIPASRFSSATNRYIYLPLYSSGGPLYSGGGFIFVVIYNHSIQTFGGKRFAFVKQKVALGIVSFL